jgi:AcrR family transcriptional regulator
VERLGRNDYFEAGLQLLAEGGAKVATIGNLCHRLGVTKGSFYHHFESGPEFMRALLLYWESAYGRQLAEAALAVEDPLARIDVLKRLAADLNHDAESAIRALARTDSFAGEVQRRLDANREDVVRRTLRDAGLSGPEARRLAGVGVGLLIGLQQMQRPVDRRRVREGLDEYQRWLEAQLVPVG